VLFIRIGQNSAQFGQHFLLALDFFLFYVGQTHILVIKFKKIRKLSRNIRQNKNVFSLVCLSFLYLNIFIRVANYINKYTKGTKQHKIKNAAII